MWNVQVVVCLSHPATPARWRKPWTRWLTILRARVQWVSKGAASANRTTTLGAMPMSFTSSLAASDRRAPQPRGTDSTSRPCEVCGHTAGNKALVAREMMFGWKDEFEYVECGACGCLQLSNVPLDLNRYYPDDYYPSIPEGTRTTGLKKLLWHWRASYCLTGRGLIGRVLAKKYGRPL